MHIVESIQPDCECSRLEKSSFFSKSRFLNPWKWRGVFYFTDSGLSNYYPSKPYYPLKEVRQNSSYLTQNSYVKDNKIVHESLDWREIVEKISPEKLSLLPAGDGEALFSKLPQNLLEAPNAEHHWFADYNVFLHVTAPGATLCSSHFDKKKQFSLCDYGYQLGFPLHWREAFSAIFESLLYPEGGGIVIAHPAWSQLPLNFVNELLDYDPRVLGIEIYSHNAGANYSAESEILWNHILASGRQCFGFCVIDHPKDSWKGRSILLPEERSAKACLKAFREGRFYGAITGNGIRFEYVNFDGQTLRARVNSPAKFLVIGKDGVLADYYGKEEIEFTPTRKQLREQVFLRITAKDDNSPEKLYSQPFMLN